MKGGILGGPVAGIGGRRFEGASQCLARERVARLARILARCRALAVGWFDRSRMGRGARKSEQDAFPHLWLSFTVHI
jgi:hypothetical protein